MPNIDEELLYNVRINNLERVEYCLNEGADINCRDKFKSTPLFYAVTTNNYPMVDFLLRQKADISFLYQDKENLLHIAVVYHGRFHHSTDIVELLIRNGIQVDCQNKYGNTPLFLACTAFAVNREVIEVLIKEGADMDLKNNYGISPYSMSAVNNMPLLKKLLDELRGKYPAKGYLE